MVLLTTSPTIHSPPDGSRLTLDPSDDGAGSLFMSGMIGSPNLDSAWTPSSLNNGNGVAYYTGAPLMRGGRPVSPSGFGPSYGGDNRSIGHIASVGIGQAAAVDPRSYIGYNTNHYGSNGGPLAPVSPLTTVEDDVAGFLAGYSYEGHRVNSDPFTLPRTGSTPVNPYPNSEGGDHGNWESRSREPKQQKQQHQELDNIPVATQLQYENCSSADSQASKRKPAIPGVDQAGNGVWNEEDEELRSLLVGFYARHPPAPFFWLYKR
ncbi:hypothetical protein SAY87_008164 [Trapa incisa]|uniref:Uncharacterized protein n=1 Tax=Trapa incisa TaxID=236973 RepID=A0AAN7KPB5_9MYRT|nr:hypothetical protein SAY87_008164 [Trapa incisa]